MVYAIVKDKIVENIVESSYAMEDGWIVVPFDSQVSIGDKYEGRIFYGPDGNIRLTPEAKISTQKIQELETAFDALMGGVSVALGL